jgi:hypothetical protein
LHTNSEKGCTISLHGTVQCTSDIQIKKNLSDRTYFLLNFFHQ